MNDPLTRLTRAIALLLALFVIVPVAASAAASEQKESEATYRQQLDSGAVKEATINKLLRRVHLVLNDGRRVYFRYPPHHHEPVVLAELKAKHVPVVIDTPTQAKVEAKAAPHHHKIRYIVGGVVIAVIVIVGVVLLINRRRRRD